jgi:hypothetical protein
MGYKTVTDLDKNVIIKILLIYFFIYKNRKKKHDEMKQSQFIKFKTKCTFKKCRGI